MVDQEQCASQSRKWQLIGNPLQALNGHWTRGSS